MDIDIIIKGGEELSEYYPKNYETFKGKIGDLIAEMFPGVGCWCISSELTDRHQAEEDARDRRRSAEFKQFLIQAIDEDPKIRELLQGKAAPIIAEEVASVFNEETQKRLRELYETDPEVKERIDNYLKPHAAATAGN